MKRTHWHNDLWLILLGSGLLLFAYSALAAGPVQQLTKNTIATSTNISYQTLNFNFSDTPYVKTLNLSGTVTGLKVYGKVNYHGEAGAPRVDVSLVGMANCTAGTVQLTAGTSNETGTWDVAQEWNIPLNGPLVANTCYFVQISGRNEGQPVPNVQMEGSNDPNSWSYGEAYNNGYEGVRDAYFIATGITGDYTSPVSNSFTITSPVSTSTADFSNFDVTIVTATTTIPQVSVDYYNFIISVSNSTSTTSNGELQNGTAVAGYSTNNATTSTPPTTIQKTTPLENGTWYAQGRIDYYNGPNNTRYIVATSSIVTFYITGFPPLSTSTALTIVCDKNSGFIAESLCNLSNVLFIPSNASVAQFQGIGDLISTKPPIGYYTQIKNAINELNSTATSTFSLGDLSSLETEVLTPFKTALSLILWFLFGFWVFRRIRHLQL